MGVEPRDFAKALLNDADLKATIALFIKRVLEELANQSESELFVRFMGVWLEQSCEESFKLITTRTESPLERVFLASLLLGFIQSEPMGCLWTPVFKEDAPTVFQRYREDHAEALKAIEQFKNDTGMDDPRDRLLNIALLPDTPIAEPKLFIRHLLEDMFDTWNTFHLTLQPRFSNIRVDGRTIRADAIVWVPSDPSFNVILECDGFDYHSDRARFTSDRRRDRVLASNGYQVMRFSGSEVFENPVASAVEALHFLHAQRH